VQRQVRTLVDGLGFPEAPRWHDGHLWCSDMAAHEILELDLEGARVRTTPTPFEPSGLGWLPDGTLLVVAMDERAVMARRGDGFAVHADLGHLLTSRANDMVVAEDGTAYVTSFGYDAATEEPRPAHLVKVDPDGRVEVVPGDLWRPNGVAVTADGATLLVAETRVHRVTAFRRAPDGRLSDPRVVGELPSGTWADGICLDADGGIWVGDPKGRACYRIVPGTGVTERIDTAPGACVACVLGGPARTTLFLAIGALGDMADRARERAGRIDAVEVDVPGAGRP